MREEEARKLATDAVESIESVPMTADEDARSETVADMVYVVKTGEGRFSVCDNGEEIGWLDRNSAIEVIVGILCYSWS
jgi:hypothetical protein